MRPRLHSRFKAFHNWDSASCWSLLSTGPVIHPTLSFSPFPTWAQFPRPLECNKHSAPPGVVSELYTQCHWHLSAGPPWRFPAPPPHSESRASSWAMLRSVGTCLHVCLSLLDLKPLNWGAVRLRFPSLNSLQNPWTSGTVGGRGASQILPRHSNYL